MDELVRLWLLLPVIISKISQFVVTCVHVRGQKVDTAMCFLLYSGVYVRACTLRLLMCLWVRPIFPWPRLERQTDMQRPAPCCTGIFLDCCVAVRQAVGGTSFSKPNDSFPGLRGWIVYSAPGCELSIHSVYVEHYSSARCKWQNNHGVITNTCKQIVHCSLNVRGWRILLKWKRRLSSVKTWSRCETDLTSLPWAKYR